MVITTTKNAQKERNENKIFTDYGQVDKEQLLKRHTKLTKRHRNIFRLCHKTAPMPIHPYVLIAFGMGLVVHRIVHRAHNFGNFCVPKFGK